MQLKLTHSYHVSGEWMDTHLDLGQVVPNTNFFGTLLNSKADRLRVLGSIMVDVLTAASTRTFVFVSSQPIRGRTITKMVVKFAGATGSVTN